MPVMIGKDSVQDFIAKLNLILLSLVEIISSNVSETAQHFGISNIQAHLTFLLWDERYLTNLGS